MGGVRKLIDQSQGLEPISIRLQFDEVPSLRRGVATDVDQTRSPQPYDFSKGFWRDARAWRVEDDGVDLACILRELEQELAYIGRVKCSTPFSAALILASAMASGTISTPMMGWLVARASS